MTANDTEGVPLLDGNGLNIYVTKNYTKEKQLINAQGTCVEQCPTNSIDNSTFGTCSMCPTECTTCSVKSSNCTSCNMSLGALYTVYNNSASPPIPSSTCPKDCPKGFFASPLTNAGQTYAFICKPCDPSCTECTQINYCTKCTMNHTTG